MDPRLLLATISDGNLMALGAETIERFGPALILAQALGDEQSKEEASYLSLGGYLIHDELRARAKFEEAREFFTAMNGIAERTLGKGLLEDETYEEVYGD
jgi:hypothetical protein